MRAIRDLRWAGGLRPLASQRCSQSARPGPADSGWAGRPPGPRSGAGGLSTRSAQVWRRVVLRCPGVARRGSAPACSSPGDFGWVRIMGRRVQPPRHATTAHLCPSVSHCTGSGRRTPAHSRSLWAMKHIFEAASKASRYWASNTDHKTTFDAVIAQFHENDKFRNS